jgi:IS5 family transposase
VKRTSIFITPKLAADLEQAAKNDPAGRKQAQLVRDFIADGLQRRKRQQRAAQ